ncbi:MAG: PDZ domain-containing protein [Saprospiraceae bacterium]|nr:PDZ domain-containing protein [Saprospiraceae bacterium]
MTDNSKFQVRLPLLLAATLAAGMFIGLQLPRSEKNLRFFQGGHQAGQVAGTLDEILRYIDARYVDSVDVSTLKVGAIGHLLELLDPHSTYITPEELKAVDDDMNGDFEGVGIEFLVVEDTIQIITPISGGPSEAAGLLSGDKIIRINDSLVAGVKIDNVSIFNKLRGTKGSEVKLGILRGRDSNIRDFTIKRDVIPIKCVDVAYMLDSGIGYVKINRFSARTYQEFMDALRPMVESQSMKQLVIDLRGNPGGFLNEAVDLLSQLFPEGKLLVYTEGRTEDRHNYKSSGRMQFNIDNVAVLIDEGSASASEIVAGAIQDHDRGWIIGRRSFGKGLVQEQYPLGDGGALRLTVARYFTPSGRCIQRDYKHGEYDGEAERRWANGELSDSSRVAQADTTPFYTGMGRVVYSGGGVTPDVFIPLDTSFVSDYFFEARQRIPNYASKWMETKPRSSLPSDLNSFVNTFNISDTDLNAFVAFLQSEGVKPDPEALARCKNELKLHLKARIAKVLFQEAGLFKVLNDDDPAVDKAIQLLKNNQPLVKK